MPSIAEPEGESPGAQPDDLPRPGPADDESDPVSAAADLLDEIDPEQARPYIATETHEVGEIVHRAGYDQRGSCLVDKDGVDFVDDGESASSLYPVAHAKRHVVTQVVEAEFVIGAVSDIRAICHMFLFV